MLLHRLLTAVLAPMMFLSAAGALNFQSSGAEPPGNDVKKDQPADELQQLIDQVLKAYGGEEKVRVLKTFTETIKYKSNQGKEVTEKRYLQVPDKYRIETRTKGEEFEDVYIFAGGFK